MAPSRYALLGAALAAAGLAGCAGPQRPRPSSAAPPPALTATYAAAATAGREVYRLDAAASQVLILVDKAGPLARFGHRHVIEAGGLRGFALRTADGGRADLEFPATGLEVDPPALRESLGPRYAEPLDADARTGTRQNMLGASVLDAARFPWITLAVTAASGDNPVPLAVRITLHGVTRKLKTRGLVVHHDRDLFADGSFAVKQSEFGIKPYSIALGALRVKDLLEIRYRLVFRRWCANAGGAKSPC